MVGTKSKQILKRLLVPLVGPLLWLLHIKVFGRHVFVNKYVRKIPFADRLMSGIQRRIIYSQTRQKREAEYRKWVKARYPREQQLQEQRQASKKLKHLPLISILMPTYNTNHEHLRECIESVISQTYNNWELCIADDHSSDAEVRRVIKDFAGKDSRIKYIFREENGHICRASTSALDLAKGEYVALLDHDDFLWPNALFEVVKMINRHPNAKFIYSDEDKIDNDIEAHSEPFFKPDWSFDFLRSINYITHFAVLDRQMVKRVGGFRPGYEGAQDWDLFLRVSQQTNEIYHIPTILYSWRKSITSTAQSPSAKDYAYVNQKKALADDIKNRGLMAKINWQIPFSMWRIKYSLKKTPLVSIIIPTKDQHGHIKKCLESIKDITTYDHYEVVIVDTGSTDAAVERLYDEYQKLLNLRVVRWAKSFNFSAVCDYGAEMADGDYLVFLNNDTEIITPDWLENMLGYAQQKEVGAVGCKLYYPDRRIQHAGIILGVGGQKGTPGIAGHFFPMFVDNPPQDPAQLLYIGGARNFAAVTAACTMVSKVNFDKVNGFDPKFRIAFNDVDFCLKLLNLGLRNVYLPNVELFHHESVSVGKPGSKQRDLKVFSQEIKLMLGKWGGLIENDPFYHPEFRRDIASARLKA